MVYHDGKLVLNVTRVRPSVNPSIDRRIVIGRLSTDVDDHYTTLEMDELLFFNQPLTDAEIRMLRPRG